MTSFGTFIIENESTVRASMFFGILITMGIWEVAAPRRIPTISKLYRWVNNLGLIFFNAFILKIIFPIATTSVAVMASQNNWGALKYFEVPSVISVIIFVIVMDMVIYFQHIMMHAIPMFWRLHRVHHADLNYDTTTGARFHTIEIILSICIKFIAIILLGPSVLAVILFEIILNATAMFNHGNVKLPKTLDKVLRWFIVTPDMHRVHHSVEKDETNSNFGFNLSIWDRIFGTYRQDVRAGQLGMTIGLKNIRKPKDTNMILGMFLIPFKNYGNKYTINSK